MQFSIISAIIIGYIISGSAALKNPICGLPHSVSGDGKASCNALIPKWTYDSKNKKCIEFNSGGCGGNANSFKNEAECKLKCVE